MIKLRFWDTLAPSYKGIILMCLSVFMFTIANVFTKTASQEYPLGQMIVYRGIIFLIILVFYTSYKYKKNFSSIFHTNYLGLYTLQGFLSSIFLFLLYYTFKVMPLSDATALNFSETFFVTLLSILLLKEKNSRNIWISLIIGFLGILFITTPSFGDAFVPSYQKGALACLLAVAIDALILISIRKLAQVDKTITLIVYYALFSTLGGFLFYPFETWVPFKEGPYLQLIGLGTSSAFAQVFLTQAFKHASAGTIAPFIYTMMIWSLFFDDLIWGHLPSFSVWIGFSLIVCSGLYIIRHEHIKEKQKELNLTNPAR